MTRTKKRLRWSFLAFPLAGLVSALLTIKLRSNPFFARANPFGSLIFGLLMVFFFNISSTFKIFSLSLHYALPIFIASFLSLGSGLLFVGSLGDDPRFLPES